MQGRPEEAERHYQALDKGMQQGLQGAYLGAYLEMSLAEDNALPVARAAAQAYANYPVPHWQALYHQLAQQLNVSGLLTPGDR